MAKRRVATFNRPSIKTKVFWNSDIEEFQVRLYVGGKLDEESDYFTTDKQDAIDTAEIMCNDYGPNAVQSN